MSEIVTACTMDLTEGTLAELREFVYSTDDVLTDDAKIIAIDDADRIVSIRSLRAQDGG